MTEPGPDPLSRLAIRHGTDKFGAHLYTPIYHALFHDLRELPIRLLEIGVGGYAMPLVGGASLRMWAEYFPNGHIVGLDIAPKRLALPPRVTIVQGSQTDTDLLDRISEAHGPFDIVIDDGSHQAADVLASFHHLYPRLPLGARYVVEDTQTAFWPEYGGNTLASGTILELAHHVALALHQVEVRAKDLEPAWTAYGALTSSVQLLRNLVIFERGENIYPSNAAFDAAHPEVQRVYALLASEQATDPSPGADLTRLDMELYAGRLDDAVEVARQAAGRYPDRVDVLDTAIRVLERAGRTAECLALADKLVALVPDEPSVAALRARIAQGAEAAGRTPSSAGGAHTALLSPEGQDGNFCGSQGVSAVGVQQPLSGAELGRETMDALACANQRASDVVMEVNYEPKKIRIRPLYRDTDVAVPSPDVWVEIRSGDLDGGPDPETWGFTQSAEVLMPSLVDLPARTRGDFTELAVDLHAPFFPERPEYTYEVDLLLRGEIIDKKVFRNFTQRHQFIVSTQLLFEDINVLTLSARVISGGAEIPRFFVRVFYIQKDRLVRILENNSIWVFSTARSGSTWLSQDILCWNDRVRPMDEPGLGKMFAPLDWIAERFYNLPEKATYFESGLVYESKTKIRDDRSAIPPFERTFIFAGQENQIWNAQNWHMYLGLLKDTAFRHVINEWGMLGYQNVVFKMPNDSHAADVIMQAFPGSFMIFLMRDGRDVMKSRFSLFGSPDLAKTTDPQLRLHAIAFYSHFWNFQVDIIQSAFSAHAPERSLFVRYEDLRRAPTEQIRLILDRIGAPISDEDLTALIAKTTLENIPADQKGPDKPRQSGEVGKYAGVFSEQEIALMEAIMGPNLRRFGYALHADGKVDVATVSIPCNDAPSESEILGRIPMMRSLRVTLFDANKIYKVQPDSIVCELESLEEWQAFVAQFAVHDPMRNEAMANRAEHDGVNSIHFGHDATPAIDRDTANSRWDINVQGVGNCQRAVLDLLAASRFGDPSSRVYTAEAMSPFARALRGKYSKFLGSQYAPDPETQHRIFPIPHQDLMQLTLPDASFDVAASIEVLEHIPNLSRALSEMARILVPGGLMFSTFPFLWTTHSTVRKAELVNGEIRHLVEKPEYHGDPMNPAGVLVFQLPGWDIVQMAKDAGFKTAKLVFYSSAIGGIIGVDVIGRFVLVCER